METPSPAAGSGGGSPGSLRAEKRRRRIYTAGQKLDLLRRAREAREAGRGNLAVLLRTEGLRTSHLSEWAKQFSSGLPSGRRRGRPASDPETLLTEFRRCRRRLSALSASLQEAERIIHLQRKYIMAAALRRERRDRGLLSELMAKVENDMSVAEACRALGVDRKDFYRTIKPRRKKAAELMKPETRTEWEVEKRSST